MLGKAHSWWRRLTGRETWSGEDRRVWVRFAEVGSTVLRSAAPGDAGPIQAEVRDLSRGGIGLVVDRRFDAGNLLLVDLPPWADRPGATVLAYVMRAEPLTVGRWELGCTFAAEPANGELAALTGRAPDDADRRAWARFPTRGSCRYYPVGGYALTCRADIVNVSPAGVGLVAGERIEPSVVLALELACPSGRALAALAGVVSASPLDDGQWLIGCAFDRELDEDEIRALCGTPGAER
jgi:hypothetical protein